MLRFLGFLLVGICLVIYVLFDSKALVFEGRSQTAAGVFDKADSGTMSLNTGLVEQNRAVPVFHGERLQEYFNKLVSKIGK